MTFDQFINYVDKVYYANTYLRYGQVIMNTLYDIWPEKHKEIINTDFDCFYDDSTARYTLSKLEREWGSSIVV